MEEDTFPLMISDLYEEIRPEIEINRTQVKSCVGLLFVGSSSFKHFSDWKNLVSAITLLLKLADRVRRRYSKETLKDLQMIQKAENIIFREVQNETYQ